MKIINVFAPMGQGVVRRFGKMILSVRAGPNPPRDMFKWGHNLEFQKNTMYSYFLSIAHTTIFFKKGMYQFFFFLGYPISLIFMIRYVPYFLRDVQYNTYFST